MLERELGRGGMATVYLAEDVRHRRRVAVKVLRPELAATLGSDRFFHEIDVAARLQHPHILPLLDSGEAGGFCFYVMPYVAGESLRERVARTGELPVEQTVGARGPRGCPGGIHPVSAACLGSAERRGVILGKAAERRRG